MAPALLGFGFGFAVEVMPLLGRGVDNAGVDDFVRAKAKPIALVGD